ENNAAIVFHEIDDLSGDLGFSDYIDIARLAGHDAVITSGEFSNEFIEAVDKIVGEGVPVVISGFEDVQSSRDVFIGTNQYEFGTIAASLAADATYLEGYTNLAVINTKIYSNEEDQIDRRIAGLTGKILTNQDMRLITINNSSSDIIGAEDVTQDILRDFPSVNVIFCMNARDTIAAAQAVVDRNKVGDVKIIGTDVTPEILDFIDKGIIYGVIDRNGEEIGRQALESILNITDEELQSSYINVNMDVVTIENADDYRE
ncbi:MAG: substrate-binding domain-containing protein, partial [Clostridia bacterium]|nr:substrate-binding domain-containing protein [Clostridia bacterium]